MTKTQQKAVLEISTQRTWKYRRPEMRRIFAACEASNYNVDGYANVLEDALVIVRRATEAIATLEK
jgi:hypothetical protein